MRFFAVGVFVLALTMGMNQKAEAQFAIEGGLGYGSDIDRLGIKGSVIYDIEGVDELQFAGGLILYLPESENDVSWTWTEVNVNAEYHFLDEANFSVYGLGGINRTRLSISGDHWGMGSGSSSGLNIGGGLVTDIGLALLDVELKYVLMDNWSRAVLSAGLRFPI